MDGAAERSGAKREPAVLGVAMGCPSDDAVLAFLEGRLSAREEAALELHIDACVACRRLLSRLAEELPDAKPLEPTPPTQLARSSLIGRQVGSYRVTDFIGAGAMGAVYLGEHLLLKHRVAIKLMHGSSLDGTEPDLEAGNARNRFFAEAQALTQIKDTRHVVALFDFGELEERRSFYYVMEHLEGHDLDCALRGRGPMRPEEALPYLQQICAGLQAAHDARILHRDLKPANVFVLDGQPLRIKLLDFGLAKLIGAQHSITLGGLGSPLYAAPELIEGEHQRVGPHTDVYAAGVILYRLLTARLPWDLPAAASPRQLFLLPLCQAPKPLREIRPEVPEAVGGVVDRCLARDVAMRPATAAELAASYESALASPAGVPPPVRSRSTAVRRRWLLAAGLSLLAIGATLVALRSRPATRDSRGAPRRSMIALDALPAPRPPAAPPARALVARPRERPTPRPAATRKRQRQRPIKTGTEQPVERGAEWILEPDFDHGQVARPSPVRGTR